MQLNKPYGIKQFEGSLNAMAFRNAASAIEETIDKMDTCLKLGRPNIPGLDWDEFYEQHEGVKDVMALLLKIADGMEAAIEEGATGLTVRLQVATDTYPSETAKTPPEKSTDKDLDTEAIKAAIQKLLNLHNRPPKA